MQFFPSIIFSINVSSKKGENQDEATASSCLVLPHASYGPENELKNHGFMLEIWLSVDHFLTQISASQESIKYSHNNILLPYSLPRVAWAGWFGQENKARQSNINNVLQETKKHKNSSSF